MRQKIIYSMLLSIVLMIFVTTESYTAEVTDYLILEDITPYQRLIQVKDIYTKQYKSIPGYWIYNNAGELAGADHFQYDHGDVTYKTEYQSKVIGLGIVVQVTQHAGSDSDKWLLHEVDAEFRSYYGIPDLSYTIRNVDGNTIFVFSSGGRDYRWISGNKVIMVEYTALQMSQKPEPLEIVKVYLAKHPSTLTPITLVQLRNTENKTIWIKDEMERRLWLCDKWFTALQQGKAEMKDVLQNTVGSMQVFLDYREKYYGIKAQDEKLTLQNALAQNNGTAIKNKLTEYKTWWIENKNKAISL